jgi:hypothetical protein
MSACTLGIPAGVCEAGLVARSTVFALLSGIASCIASSAMGRLAMQLIVTSFFASLIQTSTGLLALRERASARM